MATQIEPTAIHDLFRSAKQEAYDYSALPGLVRLRSNPLEAEYESQVLRRWASLQSKFMRWTTDEDVFSQENVSRGKSLYDRYFAERGPTRGSVLDIGGGWGLYREWWEPNRATDVYVVHDPGVERFLRGPHQSHHRIYGKAFGRPMTFVEGFGEDLPYNAGAFDTCLIASAIDHCIDPTRVLTETFRCLKPGGRLLVLQQCEGNAAAAQAPQNPQRLRRRLLKYMRSPRRLLSALYYRFTYRDPHLHHFTESDLRSRVTAAGYATVSSELLAGSQVCALTAKKSTA
jgi:ubiquinone/menaquinone biosynthesis C-methylase UbiE